MRSPILSQFDNIACSPYRIAPERIEELRSVDQKESIDLNIVECKGFRFGVNLKETTITTSIASLEYMWTTAYMYLILYREYCLCQMHGGEFFDTGKLQNTRNAIDLVKWAINNLNTSGTMLWPSDMPKPSEKMERESYFNLANEIFLCCVAWSIHHEIAHIRLRHTHFETAQSLREEKEADIAATRWITEKCKNSKELSKRAMGIATAIFSLQALEDLGNGVLLKTHPRAFERIVYCLSEISLDGDDKLFAFTSIIMQIQLAFNGINSVHDGESFAHSFSEYVYEYARK